MKYRTAVIVLLLIVTSFAAAQQPVNVSIRYEDKVIYVPDSDVFVKFTVRNDGGATYRFKLAENRMFNLDFDVRTLANTELEPAPQFTTERTSNQQLYYRDVALEPGEEFSFVENLSDYVRIEDSGVYVVRAMFYPELVGTVMPGVRTTNSLSLTVRPPMDQNAAVLAAIDDRTGEILERAALPPDAVVEYTVQGLQDGAWNRYFLYMDVEGLLLSNPNRARAFRQLSDEERRLRLERFETEVRSSLEDPQLSAIPTSIKMVRTTYDMEEATVIMDESFAFPTFTEIKRYTYFLRRRDRVWYIYDYAVTNLGSE